MTAVMVNTNVLVYVVDPTDPAKQGRAEMVSDALSDTGQGCVCAQVVCEFYNVVMRGREPLLDPHRARSAAESFVEQLRLVDEPARCALEAVRIAQERQLNVYDATLIAIAKEHGIKLILSEDFGDGCVIEGVRVVDPFADDFDLEVALSGAEW